MKLLLDMNLSPRWVTFLSAAGIEAAHWSAIGALDAPDAEIMSHAMEGGYIVLTHDLDFSSILAATRGNKPSVIQIRATDISPEAVGVSVVAAVRQMSEELAEGALITVEPNRTRLRVLPLRPRMPTPR